MMRSVAELCADLRVRWIEPRAPKRWAVASTLFLALAGSALAQPPAGYYDTADATDAASLRQTLHDIIKDHTWHPYTGTTTDTWDILNAADEDPNDSGRILDLYKNASYVKIAGGTGAYNREHSWPKSYGFPDLVDFNYPYTDCHHLFAADVTYNAERANKPFRWCDAGCTEWPTDFNDGRGGGSGVYPGNSNWTTGDFTQGTWEPWDGRKGDVARALLYMDVRYEGGFHGITGFPEPDLILTDSEALIDASNTGSNESVGYMGLLSVLLQWHQLDPPDAGERHRNDVVYGFQGNRNPFVDHPEWVRCVFEDVCTTDTTPPAAPTGLLASATNGGAELSWLVNGEPDLAGYDVYRSTTSGGPYDRVNGALVGTNAYTDSGLVNGTTYYYVVTAVDTSSNESVASSQVAVTPDGGLPDTTPPAAPTGLAATAGDGQIGLSWNANGESDLAGYDLYRATAAGGPYARVNGALIGASGYTDTGLTNGTTYYYVVTAVDTSSNESADSAVASATPAATGGVGQVLLSEVFYDPAGTDDGLEWAELFNAGSGVVDLSGYCLANGGTSWTTSLVQLAGTVAPGATFVVGGPSSTSANASPSLDQAIDFNPDFQNSGTTGDGVALFDRPCAQVSGATVPVDAVIYGPNNGSGLIDETGTANGPEVGDAPSGSSIERIDLAGSWQIQGAPTPNGSPLPPPVLNTAPVVTISSPADGATFTAGAVITFIGSASDAEDGDLSTSVVWASSLDGALGVGSSVAAALSTGTHLVTASVTDGGGLGGSDAITVVVEPVVGGGGDLILSEVFYDPAGTDDGLEWVEIYNRGTTTVDLSGYSLGAGGLDYTTTLLQLSGSLAPGATFVVGGPTSSAANHNPSLDQAADFNPDLQNSGTTGDGVALFDLPASQVTPSTVPVDAVVYGPDNGSGLIDETGFANGPEVGDAPSGSSIERTDLAGSWQIQAQPTPNTTPFGGPSQGTQVTFVSIAGEDGWVREQSETSGTGGTYDDGNTGTAGLRVGDDSKDRQYKAVLSFDTSAIPDTAVVTAVTLRLRRGTVNGTSPFSTHGTCWVDVHNDGLGGNIALTTGDFQAFATAPRSAALSEAAANGDWSEASLDAAGLAAVNKGGTTQLRVYFDLDDNDDRGVDYVGYYAADNADPANHPQLVVTYGTGAFARRAK
ncbi:MAG: endonuclease [Acidobacteria bacterium]|nr:endonuclease [Acidobacteriota bacterium]